MPALWFEVNLFAHAKICKLRVSCHGQHHIFWLDITVDVTLKIELIKRKWEWRQKLWKYKIIPDWLNGSNVMGCTSGIWFLGLGFEHIPCHEGTQAQEQVLLCRRQLFSHQIFCSEIFIFICEVCHVKKGCWNWRKSCTSTMWWKRSPPETNSMTKKSLSLVWKAA